MENDEKFDITDYLVPVGFEQVPAEVGPPLTLPIYEFPDPGTPEAERLKRASKEFDKARRKESTSSDCAQYDSTQCDFTQCDSAPMEAQKSEDDPESRGAG